MKIPIALFCDRYNVSYESVLLYRREGVIPESTFGKDRSELLIDESFLVRRYEFRRRVINNAHEIYFYLARYFKPSTISELLVFLGSERTKSSWNMFLSKQLFANPEGTIFTIRVNKMIWEFYRYARWFLIRAFKAKGRKFLYANLNKVHNLGNIDAN